MAIVFCPSLRVKTEQMKKWISRNRWRRVVRCQKIWCDGAVDTGDARVTIGGNWWVLPLLMPEWSAPISLGWGGSLADKGGLCAYSVRLTHFRWTWSRLDPEWNKRLAQRGDGSNSLSWTRWLMTNNINPRTLIFWYIVWWWAEGGVKGVWPRRRWVAASRRGRWCRLLMFSRRTRWR